MKKITLLISACIASVFTLFAQDQLMVHQNNGNITPFIASSVDSITIVSANNNEENKNEHQYVDMGLSVMWATCNIGANSPEEFGDYFAWGEKETKEEYTPENWKGTSNTRWEISNDPARNAWGGDWRVPTFWEFIELINNCKTQTCVKTSKDGYGILGTLFISKINGNKIFLPMAGHSTIDESYTIPYTSTGATGYYRASQYGLGIMLFPWNGIDFFENQYPYYVGESVRPVFGESTQIGNFEDYDIDEDLYKPEVLSLNKSNIELEVGESTQLYATSSSNVSWEILSGEGIVEIEYQGYPQNTMVYINALSDGTAVVQATDGRTKAVCVINVISTHTSPIEGINNPSMDETTLLFQIENAACDDFELYLMGIDGYWSDDRPDMKFERVDGTQDWFQITIPTLDKTQTIFKIRANGDWTYEPRDGYEFLGDTGDYLSSFIQYSATPLTVLQNAGGKVLALKVNGFVSPCAESRDYTITLKTNYCGAEGTDVAITGGFPTSGWNEAIPMEKINDTTYTFTIEDAKEGSEFKFQSTEGNWYNQPVEFNEEYSEWLGLNNFRLGEETEIFIDLTDYVWEACTPTE